VKDLYQRFINPDASEKQLVRHSRWSTAIIVILGTASTYLFHSLNDIWGWLTMGLGVGLIVPQFLRWYWWRFNGYGYAGGTLAGMVLAIGQRLVAPGLGEFDTFLFMSLGTLLICLVITLLTSPTEDDVLESFFRTTRPFGFWHRIRDRLDREESADIRTESRRDIAGILLAVPWQLVLFLSAMVFVTGNWASFGPLALVLAVLSIALYFVWFRHLSVSRPSAESVSSPDA
jgi:Na+/proline symporter